MPMYEYQCEACGEQFETIRKFSDAPLDICEKCGKGPLRRLVSSPAFQFKGSGWYITDYAKKGKDSGSSTDSPTTDSSTKDGSPKDSSTSTKSDTGSSDKPESKSSESSKTETPAKPAAPSTSKD